MTDARLLSAFRQGLKEAGYVEGQNVAIEYRWAEGQIDRLPALAAESGAPPGRRDRREAARPQHWRPRRRPRRSRSSSRIGDDPVKLGWSPASTGRAATSRVSIFLPLSWRAKRLELLRELVPEATRLAVLVNPTNAAMPRPNERRAGGGPRAWGCKSRSSTRAPSARSMRPSRRLRSERLDALFVAADPLLHQPARSTRALAARHAVPAIYGIVSSSKPAA